PGRDALAQFLFQSPGGVHPVRLNPYDTSLSACFLHVSSRSIPFRIGTNGYRLVAGGKVSVTLQKVTCRRVTGGTKDPSTINPLRRALSTALGLHLVRNRRGRWFTSTSFTASRAVSPRSRSTARID